VLPDAVRVTIELDAEVTFHDERIPDPWRVFLDLPGTRPAPSLLDQTLRFESDADIVRQVRIGRHPNNTTRVVLDAAGVTSYSGVPALPPVPARHRLRSRHACDTGRRRAQHSTIRGLAALRTSRHPTARGHHRLSTILDRGGCGAGPRIGLVPP